jgi:hypothetical protein
MVVILLLIYGALGALFWRWQQQNHLGANMKGLGKLKYNKFFSFVTCFAV